MICGRTPFQTNDRSLYAQRKLMDKRRNYNSYQPFKEFSNDASDLLQKLLKTDPKARINNMI